MSRFNSASMSSTVCDLTLGAGDGFFGLGFGGGAARLNYVSDVDFGFGAASSRKSTNSSPIS